MYELGFKNIVPGVDYFDSNWKNEDFETMYNQFVMFNDYLKSNDITEIERLIAVKSCKKLKRLRIFSKDYSGRNNRSLKLNDKDKSSLDWSCQKLEKRNLHIDL